LSARPEAEKRGPWYLLTGLILGAALGLLYAWKVSPVQYVDTSPAALQSVFKEQYRAVIASAYQSTGDMPRARSRLELLADPDPKQALLDNAQSAMLAGDPLGSAYPMAMLAQALQQLPTLPLPSPTSLAVLPATLGPTSNLTPTNTRPPTLTYTPFASATPRPTHTPTPTQGAPFALAERVEICDPNLEPGLLQVEVQNAAGKPVAGAEIIITWSDGEEHFFTGFKPELGDGYADYVMAPGVVYTLRLALGGVPVTDLTAPTCQPETGDSFWGSLRLLFAQH
jgi:hypothetical protein